MSWGGSGRGQSRSVWKRRAFGHSSAASRPRRDPRRGSRPPSPGFLREERRGHSGFSGVWSGSRGGALWPPAQPSGGPGADPGALLGSRPRPLRQPLLSPSAAAGPGHRVGTAGPRLGPVQWLHPPPWGPGSPDPHPRPRRPAACSRGPDVSAWLRAFPVIPRLPRKPVGGAPAPATPLAAGPSRRLLGRPASRPPPRGQSEPVLLTRSLAGGGRGPGTAGFPGPAAERDKSRF